MQVVLAVFGGVETVFEGLTLTKVVEIFVKMVVRLAGHVGLVGVPVITWD